MARARLELDVTQYERLQQAMLNFGVGAGQEIDSVLHSQGGKLIEEEIMRLLPESGRKWRGKKPAAKKAQPFRQENGTLSVTIRTKNAYHYLYFPDDGSNTFRHVGFKGTPRQFMSKGAENQSERIIDLCVERLIQKIGV